jgi:hypothetical protein
MTLFDRALAANPLIEILRGLEPDRALDVAGVAQCTVWSFRVVVVPPAFDDYLSFA